MDRSAAGRLGYAKTKARFDATRAEKTRQARELYEAQGKQCPWCQTPIPYEKRENTYCGYSCRAKHTLTGRASSKRKPVVACPCGQTPTGQNKFCDTCIAAGIVNQKVFSLADATTDQSRRRYLLRTRSHRCEGVGCGITVWLGQPVPLEMDHADGNSDHNTEENLRLLCPNCHALTPTHKGRNRGNGRTRQRIASQRYAAGKTY